MAKNDDEKKKLNEGTKWENGITERNERKNTIKRA